MGKEQFMNFITPRFEMKAGTEDSTDIYIYGTIGGGFWFGGVDSREIRRTLAEISTSNINVHIHSNGGDAFEGVAIGNLLKNHNATINVYIDGMCASAASVIAMAGDKIIMPKNTMMMVHRAALIAYGNAAMLRKKADILDKVDKAVIESYTSRFTGDLMELEKLLDDETYLTAEECLSYGFCDEISQPIKQAIEDNNPDNLETEVDEEDDLPIDPGIGNTHVNRFAALIGGLKIATQNYTGKE